MAETYTLADYANGLTVAAALDKAGTALQPADVGTAAAEDAAAFASAAQGGLADTAVQPNTPVQLGGAAAYLEILADGTLRLGEDGRLDRRRPLRAAAAPAAYRGLTFYNMDFSGFGGGHMDMRRAGA